jgi:glycerophosphoryl diester phosphodiesterase
MAPPGATLRAAFSGKRKDGSGAGEVREEAPTNSSMEIIAHRGSSHEAPENTLAAIRLAWRQHADAVEIDVHLSKDGHLVAIHDDNTRKTAGRKKKVRDQTLAELRALDAGSWKHRKWAGEKIPTLAEVLETIPETKRLFIEVKCGVEVLPALEQVVKESGKTPKQLALLRRG